MHEEEKSQTKYILDDVMPKAHRADKMMDRRDSYPTEGLETAFTSLEPEQLFTTIKLFASLQHNKNLQ